MIVQHTFQQNSNHLNINLINTNSAEIALKTNG